MVFVVRGLVYGCFAKPICSLRQLISYRARIKLYSFTTLGTHDKNHATLSAYILCLLYAKQLMSESKHDAIIIGGGHNGLVCACYLARAGKSVKILERRPIVGGAAVTETFYPGFRNSIASYTVGLLHPKIIDELNLTQHGLEIIPRPFANFLPLDRENYLLMSGSLAARQQQLAKFSEKDAANLPAYERMLSEVAEVLRELTLVRPPRLPNPGILGWSSLLKTSRCFRKLSTESQRDLLDLFTLSAAELLKRWFEAEPVQALFGFDSIVGSFVSPYEAGSAYILLHHVFGEVNGQQGVWGHVKGGMGSITQAMASEAQRLGVEIELECEVKEILVNPDKSIAVRTTDNNVHLARKIAANVNPKHLYLELIDESHLPPDFVQRLRWYQCKSGVFRMNVALEELPDFTCLPGSHLQNHHQAGIYFAPSLGYIDQAKQDAANLGWSRAPVVEMCIPSTIDDSLAPAGKHVASLFCQYFQPELPNGLRWQEQRDTVAQLVIDTVTKYAPNFRQSVLGYEALTPKDLEQRFGLTGGDIFHGALRPNQLFAARPVLGYGDYTTPIKNLYLCGSGAHPGGGVTGLPGYNAAKAML